MLSFPPSLLILIACLLALGALAAPTERTTACNGYAALCDRQYSNITFVGSHDSAFNWSWPWGNQHWPVATQLSDGIRFLQAQTHVHHGILSLCHTSCAEEDVGSLQRYLSTVKSFLDANPNEVVTLLLVNGDFESPELFDSTFKAAGLNTYAFVPSTTPNPLAIDSWPTLGEMISAGQRLVVFLGSTHVVDFEMSNPINGLLDYDARESEVPYILTEFNYFFETPYDTTNPSFPECSIDRPPGVNATGRMYLVNHYLDIGVGKIDVPDEFDATSTNWPTGNGSIGAQVDICVGLYGRYPNVVLLDYVDKGRWWEAQSSMNGL